MCAGVCFAFTGGLGMPSAVRVNFLACHAGTEGGARDMTGFGGTTAEKDGHVVWGKRRRECKRSEMVCVRECEGLTVCGLNY